LGVVHAHGWVVIDCRVPQESVIRIVSTMGTKESISYKMISHGSWYRQIEKERGRATAKSREEERGKATAKSREKKREALEEIKRQSGETKRERKGLKGRACRRCRVEVSEEEKRGRESEMESECVEEGGREEDK